MNRIFENCANFSGDKPTIPQLARKAKRNVLLGWAARAAESEQEWRIRAVHFGFGFSLGRRQEGNMRRHNSPSLREAHPHLALSAEDLAFGRLAFKFESNAGEIASKTHNIQPFYGTRKIGGWPAFPEGFQFLVAVEIFGDSEAHYLGRSPEHGDQRIDIVQDQRLFIARIEFPQFGENLGQIDVVLGNRHRL